MTRMKDSGIEWIGEVPEEWGLKPIKYLVSTPVTDGPHETPTLYDDGIPFLSAESVKNGILDSRYKRGYISETAHKIFSRKVSPQKNDIFIVKSGATTGNVGIVTTDEIFDIWSPLALVRTRSDLANQKFIYYFMLSDAFTKQIQNKWSFGTQQNIGMGVIEKIKLVVPPLDEQTQIANFLDKKVAQLDSVKSLLEEQVKTLEDYRQSLIYQTVTKGLDKTVPLKDSGVDWIGQIPEGWGVGKLKYYFDVQLGKMLQPSAINGNDIEIDYLRAINVQWDNILVDNLSKMWCNPSEVSKYEIMNGDLLVCEGGEVGRCGIVEYLSDRAIIQNAVHRIRSAERANVRFLNYYIQHTTKSKWFDILCNKATIAHLTSEKLLNTLVVLPSISEQIQIADFLDKKTEQINQMIAIKKEQIENINKQRQTLIYDVVTGKRRI